LNAARTSSGSNTDTHASRSSWSFTFWKNRSAAWWRIWSRGSSSVFGCMAPFTSEGEKSEMSG
jgi:hypothetical protein